MKRQLGAAAVSAAVQNKTSSPATLKRLYALWLLAVGGAICIGVLYYKFSMQLAYHGHIESDDDFAGLPYFIEALIMIVFATGALTAGGVYALLKQKSPVQAGRLAWRLVAFYSAYALLMVVTFNWFWIYFNPLSLLIFVMLPFMAWKAAQGRRQTRRSIIVFAILLLLILAFGMWQFYLLVRSDPFHGSSGVFWLK